MISAATAMARVFMRTPSPGRLLAERQHMDRAEHECARATAGGRVGMSIEVAQPRPGADQDDSGELLAVPLAWLGSRWPRPWR